MSKTNIFCGKINCKYDDGNKLIPKEYIDMYNNGEIDNKCFEELKTEFKNKPIYENEGYDKVKWQDAEYSDIIFVMGGSHDLKFYEFILNKMK